MRQLRYVLTLALFAGFGFAQQGSANLPESAVVIQSGTYTITKAEFEQMLKADKALGNRKLTPEERRKLGEQYGMAFALESEAKRQKLDQRPDIKLQIRSMIQQFLSAQLLEETREEYLTEELGKTRAYYEKAKSKFEEPHVRQILVRTAGSKVAARPGTADMTVDQARARALDLRQKLLAGADFATLAKESSDDLGTAPKGGDLGFVPRGSTVAEFEAVAYSLPAGKISDVFQTEFGFFIIRVEERQPQSFDKIKEALANDLAHQELDQIMLKAFKLNEAYFGK